MLFGNITRRVRFLVAPTFIIDRLVNIKNSKATIELSHAVLQGFRKCNETKNYEVYVVAELKVVCPQS